MDAETKAEQLVSLYKREFDLFYRDEEGDSCIATGVMTFKSQIDCALIMVDEIMRDEMYKDSQYWKDVKRELNRM